MRVNDWVASWVIMGATGLIILAGLAVNAVHRGR